MAPVATHLPLHGTPRHALAAPWGVLLALVAALGACRAREGERCVCAEDCADGLACVTSGRLLEAGECAPAVGADASPGVCLPADQAAEDDGGGGPPVIFMDMGSKLDFEPGPPPDPETETASTVGTTDATAGTTDATAGTTDATNGTTDATNGTTDATGTSDATGTTGSTGGTTDATGTTGTTGGTTDASTGSTGAGT